MRIGIWGILGCAVGAAVILTALYWLVTRRLLVSTRYRSRPSAAFKGAWQSVFGLIKAAPLVALAAFCAKLFQILGKDIQNIALRRHPMAWSLTGLAIDLLFALIWAAVAMRIYFSILAPDLPRADLRRRTRSAMIYALAFWAVAVAVNAAGIGLVYWVRGADHGMVVRIIGYLSYALTVVAVLTRPGIATGLPRPLKEAFRVVRENWFGGGVTLILGALPLGLVFLSVNLISDFVRLKLYVALLLEVPIAAASALCYLAFEGTVAAMYRRVM